MRAPAFRQGSQVAQGGVRRQPKQGSMRASLNVQPAHYVGGHLKNWCCEPATHFAVASVSAATGDPEPHGPASARAPSDPARFVFERTWRLSAGIEEFETCSLPGLSAMAR